MSSKIKPFEELTFADDFMFNKVMHDPEICAEVIERLLHIKVDHIVYPEIQKSLQPYYTSKGVRSDVYLKDSDRVFDIEMQNGKEDYLGKRTRYYQSMIDIDNLMRGEQYTELKESFIIFICNHDPFGAELPQYTFMNSCKEKADVELNDKTVKVIYNAKAYEKTDDEELKAFLRFVCNNTSGDGFTDKLKSITERIKQNELLKTEYLAVNLHDFDIRREALKEGREEGARTKAIEAAVMLVKDFNATPELAAEKMNAPLEDVLEALKGK